MSKGNNRQQGRHLTAIDIAERLLPDLKVNEFLLWSPDLFAYTSYILSLTGAYQLVVSPPRGRQWFPKNAEIKEWLGIEIQGNNITFSKMKVNLEKWLTKTIVEWGIEMDSSEIQNIITEVENDAKGLLRFRKHTGSKTLVELLKNDEEPAWVRLVQDVGDKWSDNLNEKMTSRNFALINDAELDINGNSVYKEGKEVKYSENLSQFFEERVRAKELLWILLNNTPGLLLACWAYFYNQINDENFYIKDGMPEQEMHITDLLCNDDSIQCNKSVRDELWQIVQALVTMHAIADISCTGWGIRELKTTEEYTAKWFAEKLLFSKGSLSTVHPERGRVMPKRHNPSVGITLRSISSNLGFYRSSVEVVWRKAEENNLVDKLLNGSGKDETLSMLLLPFPLTVKTKDFEEEDNDSVKMSEDYGFFTYKPDRDKEKIIDDIIKVIKKANEELDDDTGVDIIVLPESSLKQEELRDLQKRLEELPNNSPSLYIAGVIEAKDSFKEDDGTEANFSRNAVYSKYYYKKSDSDVPDEIKSKWGYGGFAELEPKTSVNRTKSLRTYKQYKHHRWQLDKSQIIRYGLSRVLKIKNQNNHDKHWWEAMKVSRRRVSFLNIGDKITVSNLICEDLVRQDPIADLIRHVGPSLVVTILMDGPQLKNRWSSRYATILSDDPGSSVITLTSLGMVKRHISEFGSMSRVIALWSESGRSNAREIELADGAEGVLLTLQIEEKNEKTADGRQERIPTSVIRLFDVIQIYPDKLRLKADE